MKSFTHLGVAALAAFLAASQLAAPALPQTPGVAERRLDHRFNGLIRHDGKPFHLRDLAGKPTLIFFGFTSCGQVCPMGLTNITLAAEELERKYGPAAVPNLVLITTLPTHEGADHLAAYLKNFHPGFIGLAAQKESEALMGDPDALKKVRQIEAIAGRFVALLQGHHSPFAYLMDGRGEFLRPPLNTQDGHEKLASAMALHLKLNTDVTAYPGR